MSNEIEGQYRVIGYIDDLEEAARRAKTQKLSVDIIKGIDEIHDKLVDLQPLLTDTDCNDKLKEYLGNLIGELVLASAEGKIRRIEGLIKLISDKVEKVKEELA